MNDRYEIKISSGGFPSLLTVLFIGLKLTEHINWPWFWVLSPLLISITLYFVILIMWWFFMINRSF
jgi:hypothetical protein